MVVFTNRDWCRPFYQLTKFYKGNYNPQLPVAFKKKRSVRRCLILANLIVTNFATGALAIEEKSPMGIPVIATDNSRCLDIHFQSCAPGLPAISGHGERSLALQARLQLEPEKGAVRASLLLPARPSGFSLAQENFISRGFGLTLQEEMLSRQADWAIRRLREPKTLYYRALVIPDTQKQHFAARPGYPPKPELEEPYGTALKDIVDTVRAESADTQSFTAAMLARLTGARPDENMDLFLADVKSRQDKLKLAQTLLAGAHIPSLQLHGLTMEEDVQRADIDTLFAVFNGEDWLVFDPRSGHMGLPPNFFIWWTGDAALASVSGAHLRDLQVS
jgi:hypothetical protein